MTGRAKLLGLLLAGVSLLSACSVPPASGARQPAGAVRTPAPEVKDFNVIRARVLPVAERVCEETPGQRNCDFEIELDTRPGQQPNAYSTQDGHGRPILIMTQALIDDMHNADEVAFALSHEASHHILDHLAKQRQDIYDQAVAAGQAAAKLGGNSAAIAMAQQLGAATGSRVYSKEYELQADALGARIAWMAGYDPLRGVLYFTRAADPGDSFLSSHPPNKERIANVRQAMKGIEPGN